MKLDKLQVALNRLKDIHRTKCLRYFTEICRR